MANEPHHGEATESPSGQVASAHPAELYEWLNRAIVSLQLYQNLVDAQARQIQKLRTDLLHARELRAIVLQVADDVGALRQMVRHT